MVLSLAFGLLIGASLGGLGGGGSILTVPVLVYALGQSTAAATGTSLVVVGVSSLAGLAAHARAGHVLWGPGLTFGLLGAVGTVAGTRWSKSVDEHALLTGFAALMFTAAAVMLVRQRRRAADHAEEVEGDACSRWTRCWVLRAARVLAGASAVGLLTGFFGVGGGFIAVPALTLALGLSMPSAVGTSLLVVGVNAAVGLAARVGTTFDLHVVLPFAAAAIAGTFAGTVVSSRLPAARLTQGFAVMLIGVAAYVASQNLPQILS